MWTQPCNGHNPVLTQSPIVSRDAFREPLFTAAVAFLLAVMCRVAPLLPPHSRHCVLETTDLHRPELFLFLVLSGSGPLQERNLSRQAWPLLLFLCLCAAFSMLKGMSNFLALMQPCQVFFGGEGASERPPQCRKTEWDWASKDFPVQKHDHFIHQGSVGEASPCKTALLHVGRRVVNHSAPGTLENCPRPCRELLALEAH